MEDKIYKKKGYLLVDMVLALALISILFLGIGKSYSTYINNNYYIKEKIKVAEIINSLAMELKHNISFEDLRSIESGTYKISSLNVNDLINNDIKEFLVKNLILHNKNHNDLGWTINISHFDQYESIINIIYKSEKPYISENIQIFRKILSKFRKSTAKRKRKAYLLIELCIYLGSLGIITLSLTKNLIFYVKEYKRFIPKEKELNYLLDAEMYLNHRFWDNMVEDIKINKDKNYILVKFWRDGIVAEDKIEKIKNKLYVYYNYTGYGRNYSPALIEDVEKFDLMEKGNLFYIKLKVKNQEERIYCYEKA